MKLYTLGKSPGWNPYIIHGGNEISRISIFKGGEVIARTGRGWLPMTGSNNSGNSVLESLEYRRKRKSDFHADYSYFIGEELYICADQLPGFLFAPDVKQLATDENTYYGHMVYFECSSTDGRYPHLEKVELRGFMMGSYSKIIPTDRGEHIKRIQNALESVGVKIPSFEAAKVVDNAAAIVEAINND